MMLPIALPATDHDRSRLRATARWHRTQAAIARRKRSERDRLRHLAIAGQIEKVARDAV